MITEYHRPASLDEAIELIERDDIVVLAGGTSLSAAPPAGRIDAVDLQALGLSGVETEGEFVRMGAMTVLQDVADSPLIPPIIRDLARREAPSAIRNAATVGGTIATNDHESELLAGLLALKASVTVVRSDATVEHRLDEIVADTGLVERAIITRVSIDSSGQAVAHRTGRTPMDRPIVMLVGRKNAEGEIAVAITGVASRVVVIAPRHVADLDPPSDFRGSSAYRKHLARVLTQRALEDLGGGEGE